MIASSAAPPRLRTALLATILACIACLAVAIAAPRAGAEGTIDYVKESLAQYQSQLAGGQVKEVTINKRVRSLRVTLSNGDHMLAKYAPKQEPKYEAALKAKGVPVTILTPTEAKAELKGKPVHHKIRYIVGGVLILVLIVVGAVLLVNRRRQALIED